MKKKNQISATLGKGLLVIIICGILALYLAGILTQMITTLGAMPMSYIDSSVTVPKINFNFITVVCNIFTNKLGLIVGAVIFAALIYFFLKKIRPRIPKKETGTKDEDRNFNYSDKGTYGTSLWIEREELAKVVEVKPVEDTKGDIIGYFRDTNEVISLPTREEFEKKTEGMDERDKNNIRLNNHKAVFGASGTMKSRALARNSFLQAIRRGESIVVTDPSGELYEGQSEYAREQGYNVKCLNFVNQKNSDSWNALQCINDSDDSEITAKILVETIIANTGAKSDYWNDSALNFLKAICLFVAETPNIPTNIPQVYDIITSTSLETLEAYFDNVPDNKASKRAYKLFNRSKKKAEIQEQIINGLGVMLDVFQSETTRNITSYDEIKIEDLGKEKCAYFVITSDQHSAFDFVVALFYSMLFIQLAELAQKQENRRLKVPVNLILDEFANIGQIPDFTKKISTVRKYDINIMVIFQNIAQLMNRYPFGQWEEILGNCDTKVFLGCTDNSTSKYISETLGVASVEVETDALTSDKEHIVMPKEPTEKQSKGVGKRNLMNTDEVLRFKNSDCILMLRGQKPVIADKYDYSKHPDSAMLRECKICDYVPQWRKEMEERKENEKERERQIVANEDKEIQVIHNILY